ncbi:unnamed protein product [Bursaphelenchus okinawaensis]|uniref:Uncharacterized protein n=1 Tax=Bursaphelenchus okinawaensis TaxID=465554 RepID=A0A811JRU2_9BILA|nr:unnamed protein product [Bursaphelenchus okinawaensis]CAG9080687.1 unnamed protein product [Bursaphelenchus okinawaensis]
MELDRASYGLNTLPRQSKDSKSKGASDAFGTPRRALGDVKNSFATPKLASKSVGFSSRLNFAGDDGECKQLEAGFSKKLNYEPVPRKLDFNEDLNQNEAIRKGDDQEQDVVEDDGKCDNALQFKYSLPDIDYDDVNLKPDTNYRHAELDDDMDCYIDLDYHKTIPIPERDEDLEDSGYCPWESSEDFEKNFNWSKLTEEDIEHIIKSDSYISKNTSSFQSEFSFDDYVSV